MATVWNNATWVNTMCSLSEAQQFFKTKIDIYYCMSVFFMIVLKVIPVTISAKYKYQKGIT